MKPFQIGKWERGKILEANLGAFVVVKGQSLRTTWWLGKRRKRERMNETASIGYCNKKTSYFSPRFHIL